MVYGVLGGTGFLGKHVCAILRRNNIECIAGSRATGVDARSLTDLTLWLKQHQISHLINLAAECGGIGLNQRVPAELWLATTQIVSTVLEAARTHSLEKLTLVGTVCSYAKDCPTPFKESDLLCHGFPEPTNAPYGVAKINGLFGSMAYRQQYKIPSIFLLPVNLYGPGDNFDDQSSHVIPAIIKKCIAARNNQIPLECWGTGSATREFLYVEDAARAIVAATKFYNEPDPVNIGSGQEISIKDLVALISELVGYAGRVMWDNTKPDGQPRRCLDTTKAQEKFGFTAKTNLRDGLQNTITWYEAQLCK